MQVSSYWSLGPSGRDDVYSEIDGGGDLARVEGDDCSSFAEAHRYVEVDRRAHAYSGSTSNSCGCVDPCGVDRGDMAAIVGMMESVDQVRFAVRVIADLGYRA